jgi:hypothetical protein
MANGDRMFPALAELAGMDAADQRRVLRPRKQGEFHAEQERRDLELRGSLDRELQRIALRELSAQVASGTTEDYGDIPNFAKLLKESPAFVQYLNACLYFGVRFAAGRIPQHFHDQSRASDASDCNETPVGLPSPPPLCEGAGFHPGDVKRFKALVQGDEENPVKAALDFLDDFVSHTDRQTESKLEEPPAVDDRTNFELWLRGVYYQPDEKGRFRELTAGLLRWARSRYDFYTSLESKGEKAQWVEEWKKRNWEEGRWNVNNPVVARCAIVDFYWLARILRADVSPRGLVAYSSRSWLYYLAMKLPLLEGAPTEPAPSQEVLRWEEVLRSVFGYACDLVQNAIEIVEEREELEHRKNKPREYPPLPKTTKSWRAVYDLELQEIRDQRTLRQPDFGPSSIVQPGGDKCKERDKPKGWSRRVRTGEDVDNMVGIALSGGGIRSATFNLGLLQHLQELDLLRQVDYLSTVSGGGYIGAWLLGNVRRTRYWLSRMTSWDKSIEYLRRYSNYLAPSNGLLSPDTWTMWGTWIRNAFLVQLTVFVQLAFLLVSVLFVKPFFVWFGQGAHLKTLTEWALAVSLILIGSILAFCLWPLSHPRVVAEAKMDAFVKRLEARKLLNPLARACSWAAFNGDLLPQIAAGLGLFGSFLAASLLWGQAVKEKGLSYSSIVLHAWSAWPIGVSAVFVLSLCLIAFCCFRIIPDLPDTSKQRTKGFLPLALGSALTCYLALCGLLRLYGEFVSGSVGDYSERGAWYAFVFGPPFVIAAVTLAIVIFIGLLGHDSYDRTREWWTRCGSWIGMIGAGVLALTLAAVFSPLWVYRFVHAHWWGSVKIGAVLGWLVSVVGGLLAGNNARTGRQGSQTSSMLQWVALLGGFLFIVGAVALASTGIDFILGEALLPVFDPAQHWWNLTAFSAGAAALASTGIFLILGEALVPVLNPALYWPDLTALGEWWLLGILVLLFAVGWLFSRRFNLNTFGLNQFYRNRLVRCYLGATRWQPGKRHPDSFTGFDDADDMPLASLSFSSSESCQESFRGPFPIVNCTLDLGGSSDLALHTRHGASFILTPLFCGAPREKVGYAPTRAKGPRETGYAREVMLGQAISVSGAAVNPNMGYNTSPLVSFLLTMFNVRLGWWFPNPGRAKWNKTGPLSALDLVWELFGLAGENGNFVNVSDGGHFENLGIYELIRRRTRVIIAADAECDPELTFGSLGNVIRICETDFGAKIDIDVSSIRKPADSCMSQAHCAVGRITYSNGTLGYLIYIKASLTGDEDVGIAQYHSAHPAFPHQSTADQFFSEDQFEAYRRLGHHVAERTFRDAENEAPDLFVIAGKLFDLWIPASSSNQAFLNTTKAFDRLWDRFRTDPSLALLFQELNGNTPTPPHSPVRLSTQELCACMELIQLMENVFLDLRLDDFWDHPDNRGWAMLFTMCSKSPKFRYAWNQVRHVYGIRFEYFCDQHLGLTRDRPVVRV